MDHPYARPALAIAGCALVGWIGYQTLFSGFHLSLRLILWVAGLAVFAWMGYQHVYGVDQRPKGLIAFALLLTVVGVMEYRAQSAELRLAEAVSKVAKRPVGVICQGLLGNLVDIGQELGTVQFDEEGEPADVTHIKRDACNWAKEYAGGNYRVTRNSAVAVEVLAHEAIHLRGWTDEAVTECYGMQHMVELATELGAPEQKARQLADFYFRMLYPMMPDEYRNEALCRNGGTWDIRKNDERWP
jgi:hypothetical protein